MDRTTGVGPSLLCPRLIGRERETEVLRHHVARLADDAGGVLVLTALQVEQNSALDVPELLRRELIAKVFYDQYAPRLATGTALAPSGWFSA